MQAAFERLVVPVSGSEIDSRVLDILPAFLCKNGGAVTFLYVVEVAQAMRLDAELPAEIAAGEQALLFAERSSAKLLQERNTQLVTELLQARAAGPAIVDEAIERRADAIVMTAIVHRKHGRATLGATTEHVLINAPCEVIVIRTVSPDPLPTGANRQ
jgi:nucleotide-binding universal stress UspA family protein